MHTGTIFDSAIKWLDRIALGMLLGLMLVALLTLDGCASKVEQVDDPNYEDAKVCLFYLDGLPVNIESDLVAYWAIADNVCYKETSPSGNELLDCGRKNLTVTVDPSEGNCLWVMDAADNEVTGNYWSACTVKDQPLTVKRVPVRWDITLRDEPNSYCANHIPQCGYAPVADWGSPLTDGVIQWPGSTAEKCCDDYHGAEYQPFCQCYLGGGTVDCDRDACACNSVDDDADVEPGWIRCNYDANSDGIMDDGCIYGASVLVCTADLDGDGTKDRCPDPTAVAQ
jgi:hypothetical protein